MSMKTYQVIKISEMKEIGKLSRKSIKQLREINNKDDRAYKGKELTKYQLIYQIMFKADSP